MKSRLGSALFIALALTLGVYGLSTNLSAQETMPPLKYGDPMPANLFIELAKAINPAVVNISTTQKVEAGRGSPYGRDPILDLFERYMGQSPHGAQPAQSLGTGFVIRSDGLILTNSHVVDQADIIKVKLSEESSEYFEATVIGKDPRTDIALIKIDAKKKLPVAVLGRSDNLQVGEWVAAFGNPYGHDHSMTKGIISAIGRRIDEINLLPFIQTDASINPGNSGGPLVNTKGQVIAVNTAIDARAQGIGFAIPIDEVKAILPQLEKEGRINRAFLGIGMADLDPAFAKELGLPSSEGSLVREVAPGSGAEKAGLQPYDFIVEFNGKKVRTSNDLVNHVQRLNAGANANVKFYRDGKAKTASVALGSQPGENIAGRREKNTYQGQKAPFDLGFKIADYSKKLAVEFQLPPLRQPLPVVIEVDPKSPALQAGLAPGDVILDVNKNRVANAKDVIRLLKKDANNLIRVLKQDRVVLIYLRG